MISWMYLKVVCNCGICCLVAGTIFVACLEHSFQQNAPVRTRPNIRLSVHYQTFWIGGSTYFICRFVARSRSYVSVRFVNCILCFYFFSYLLLIFFLYFIISFLFLFVLVEPCLGNLKPRFSQLLKC